MLENAWQGEKTHHVLLRGIFESATPPAGGVPAVFLVSAPRLTPWATESGALAGSIY